MPSTATLSCSAHLLGLRISPHCGPFEEESGILEMDGDPNNYTLINYIWLENLYNASLTFYKHGHNAG